MRRPVGSEPGSIGFPRDYGRSSASSHGETRETNRQPSDRRPTQVPKRPYLSACGGIAAEPSISFNSGYNTSSSW